MKARFPFSRLPAALSAAAVAVALLLPSILSSQNNDPLPHPSVRPDLWVTLQDGQTLFRVPYPGDTIDAELFSAGYHFLMSYDSACLVRYTFTEPKLNNQVLHMATWREGTFVNADNRILNAKSGTKPFRPRAGDTVSYYKEFYWVDPIRNGWGFNNYFSVDTLEYVVELARVSDSSRVARLDSFGILPCNLAGRPTLYGTSSLCARPFYVVPAWLDSAELFMRILLHHRGPGEYWFSRADVVTAGLSRNLRDTNHMGYIRDFLASSPKMRIGDPGGEERVREPNALEVLSVNRDGSVEAVVHPKSDGESLTVGVYDMNGELLVMPLLAYADAGRSMRFRCELESGTYLLVLKRNGIEVDVEKVVVTR